jgi:enoyl-CoA hydratase
MSEPQEKTVRVEIDDGIALVTLDRPHAKNALSIALQRELAETFARLDADEAVRVLILTGAGDAFCAGIDLKEFGTLADRPEARETPDVWAAMAAVGKPIIGAINGPAVTGGFELALACDVLIAGRSARFADTHGRVGVLPGAGVSQRLSRAIGPYRAKYLSLTGNFLHADQAAAWGLVSHVVDDEVLIETARSVARDMLGLMPHMLPALKTLIDDGYALPFGEAMRLESARSREQIRTMKPQQGASAAFAAVRERGRDQKQ